MYTGKTVLITGTSRGVGLQLAEYFLYHNAIVLGLNKTPSTISDRNFYQYEADLSKPGQIEIAFEVISKVNPKIDICINNAAVLTSQYSTKMKTVDAVNMVNVDLLAPFLICREVSKLMYGIPYGRIINIGSIADVYEAMGDSVYAACKAGLKTMTNILAKEYSWQNVTCNTLAISAIDTDMLAQHKPEKVNALVKTFPIPRKAIMDDIINVIDFFCSKKSDYITAQTIYLGGLHR